MSEVRACSACLARSWLLGELGGHLDAARSDIDVVLGLPDAELVSAVAGRHRDRICAALACFSEEDARERLHRAGLAAICRCEPAYPDRLRELVGTPAVVHIRGELDRVAASVAGDPVAVVGSRRATRYGIEVARWLGRSLASAGVAVISGMALGIDRAAHEGALAGGGLTLAVLASAPERAYPPAHHALHRRIAATGGVISELPPATSSRRWMFPARNRVIAALAAMTVVVEAGARSGALLTARFARQLQRPLGAVPGRVTSPQAEGCHQLLRDGAHLVDGPEHILELLFGAEAPASRRDPRPALEAVQRDVLGHISMGRDTVHALLEPGAEVEDILAVVAALELGGYIRREAGGRLTVLP